MDFDQFPIKDRLGWVPEDCDFVGWVPCLSGSLRFELIQSGLGENKSNVKISEKENSFIIYSSVDWKDRKCSEVDGLFSVIAFMSVDAEGQYASGSVFIAPQEFFGELWLSRIFFIKDSIESSAILKCEGDKKLLLYDPFLRDIREHRHEELYKINYKICKKGFCGLQFARESKEEKERDISVACRQAFYFLKYALHQHKHHPHNDDSLSIVFPYQEARRKPSILYENLTNQIVRLKRHYDTISYVDKKHTGFVAYTFSLLESLRSYGLVTIDYYKEQVSYLTNIERSISSMDGDREDKRLLKNNAVSAALQKGSVFISLMTLYFIGVRSLMRDNPDENIIFASTYRAIFSSWPGLFSFFLISSMLLLSLWFYETKGGRLGKISRKYSRLISSKRDELAYAIVGGISIFGLFSGAAILLFLV